MLEIDKTDFRWNWALSWAVNNLYYDLLNVDVTHVPYARTHRNSSFFLKTRLGYIPEQALAQAISRYIHDDSYEVTDVKTIWDDNCSSSNGEVYIMVRAAGKKWIFKWWITKWSDWTLCFTGSQSSITKVWDWTVSGCWDWKMFVTDYAKWSPVRVLDSSSSVVWHSWVQVNWYENWTTVGYFSTSDIETWDDEFYYDRWSSSIKPWDYLVITNSLNQDTSWFAWQVRLITWITSTGRLTLDSPWLWFKTLNSTEIKDSGSTEVTWDWLTFMVFHDWGSVIGFTDDNNIRLVYGNDTIDFEDIWSNSSTSIIWVADANNKVFILTDNWYVHYNHDTGWYNKFYINDDMMAWPDKTSLVAYKDFLLAFGSKHISVWVPDDANRYYTMYNQSTSIWVWSRYAYAEYEWDLIFVSNDKRLLALWVSATAWRYMLEHEDVWEMLNGKLATMLDTDEAYVWSYNNNLRVFVLSKESPYKIVWWEIVVDDNSNNMTHIYKFDTLFKVWSEDHLSNILMTWVYEWLWYWRDWVFVRWLNDNWEPVDYETYQDYLDDRWTKVKAQVNAYLVENENNWLEWQPSLFSLAKLNRLITTLWPGRYSNNTKIHIQSYLQWIWVDYEFPVWTEDGSINNYWIDYITKTYIWEEVEIEWCLLDAVQDSQQVFTPNPCGVNKISVQDLIKDTPRCEWRKEYMLQEHWTCINDTLYTFSPTMPLVAEVWDNQNYSTQIKIEIISELGDIMTFGWFLAEVFVSPIWYKWPDWEYQLQTKTGCN